MISKGQKQSICFIFSLQGWNECLKNFSKKKTKKTCKIILFPLWVVFICSMYCIYMEHDNNSLWPLDVGLCSTISSDIIDVTDVTVIKLAACEGPLYYCAVWWIIGKVRACFTIMFTTWLNWVLYSCYWCFLQNLPLCLTDRNNLIIHFKK